MSPANFLWLDFRRDTSTSGLFHSLVPSCDAPNLFHPCETATPIQACHPHFLCFEFDIPQANDLAVLRQTRRHYPDLPILMITESHSESLAAWAYRSGVWDYLVKPLRADELNTRIEILSHLCLGRHPGDAQLACAAPLHRSVHLKASWEIPQRHKTLLAGAYVEKHFAEIVRLPVVAGLCHMSESEFSRVFKKEYGHTFCEYLLRFRICKACELLADASVRVKTVAFDVGFNDLSYFDRTFRRYTGVTPSQYQHVPSIETSASMR